MLFMAAIRERQHPLRLCNASTSQAPGVLLGCCWIAASPTCGMGACTSWEPMLPGSAVMGRDPLSQATDNLMFPRYRARLLVGTAPDAHRGSSMIKAVYQSRAP